MELTIPGKGITGLVWGSDDIWEHIMYNYGEEKKGLHTKPDRPETKVINHTGWSERKNSSLKAGHGG